jgi:hypothetical protein
VYNLHIETVKQEDSMSTIEFQNDIDKLLVEIAFSAATHGLVDEVGALARYLLKNERTAAPAILASAVANMVRGNYDVAENLLDCVLSDQAAQKFHEEANTFKQAIAGLRK